MFEKYEKFWVLGIIALVIYYFYKKGSLKMPMVPGSATGPYEVSLESSSPFEGSVVNTTHEPGAVQPAQSSTPVIFRPAQPSTVGISQKVSAGSFTWYPAPPTLRLGTPAQVPIRPPGTIYGYRQFAA